MGFNHPKTSFSDDDLAQLEWILDSVCASIKGLHEDTKGAIRRRLFVLACSGMSSEELRDHLITNFTPARVRSPVLGDPSECQRRASMH